MVCEKCGATLDDGVAFCTKCGVRVDGKKQCEKCGEWLSPDVTFCPKCGTRTDGKKVCAKCGKLLDGDILFCPDCGTPVQVTKAAKAGGAQKSAQNGNAVAADTSVHKVLTKTKTALALALAAIALLFVFLITIGGDWLYYYFGDVYDEIDMILGGGLFGDFGYGIYGDYGFEAKVSLYLPAALGTATAAATLITVFVLALKAIITCSKQLMGKTEKSGEKCALGAFFAYLVGVLMLHSITHTELDKLGGSTIAGIILGAFLTAGYIALSVVCRGKSLLQKNTLVKTIFNAGGIVMLFIFLILLSMPMTSVNGMDMSHTSLLMTIGVAEVVSDVRVLIFAVVTLGIFAFLLTLAAYSAKHFVKKVTDLTEPKGYVKCAVINLVFSILLLAFAIVGDIVLDELGLKFVMPIIVAVFAVLNLVLACVQSSFYKKIDAAEANEQIA